MFCKLPDRKTVIDGIHSQGQGFTVWLTGLSAAGKTTLAHSLAEELRRRGKTRLEILDGDILRTTLSKGLGFSKEDRETHIRRIAFICKLLTHHDVVAIAAVISPYREGRDSARREIGRFVEVFVKCPLNILIQRDPKGLYRKALDGTLTNLTGVSDPYEEPLHPDIIVETDRETVNESTQRLMSGLEKLGCL